MINIIHTLTHFAADKISVAETGIPAVESDVIFQNILTVVYFVAGFIAVIAIIIGAIVYATAGASEKNVTTGKNMILYSAIGLVVIGIAFGLTQFVIGRF